MQELIKNIFSLASASIASQLLNILFLPIISRIFSPVEIGIYQTYLSAVSLLGAIMFLKFENIILTKKNNSHINVIVMLCIIISAGPIALIFIGYFLYLNVGSVLRENFSIIIIVLGSLSVALCQIFFNIGTAKSIFKEISLSKISVNIIKNISIISVGSFISSYYVLITGFIMSNFFGMHFIYKKVKSFIFFKKKYFKYCYKYFLHYWKFSAQSTITIMLNIIILQFPVYYLAKLGDVGDLGQFSLAYRALIMPCALISGAVSQSLTPYFLAIKKNKNKQLSIIGYMALFMAPIIPAVIYGSNLLKKIFIFIFGDSWVIAASIAVEFSSMIYLVILSSSLSHIFIIREKMKILMIINLFFSLCIPFLLNFFEYNAIVELSKNLTLFYNLYYSVVFLGVLYLVVKSESC